jgi:hypothetical protein
LHIPTIYTALADYSKGVHYSAPWAWLFVLYRFFVGLLELSIMGHVFIATCRLCGFNILRNTYKPLQAKTIAEFWNRYNFYFKELLVEFFFYPAYFRYFKKHPRLRLFFSTICAATFGNIVFHFFVLAAPLMKLGLKQTLLGFIPFIFYSVVLGISIGVSQLRNLPSGDKPAGIKSVISAPLIFAFYAILGLFNLPYQKEDLMVNFKILASLFFISW